MSSLTPGEKESADSIFERQPTPPRPIRRRGKHTLIERYAVARRQAGTELAYLNREWRRVRRRIHSGPDAVELQRLLDEARVIYHRLLIVRDEIELFRQKIKETAKSSELACIRKALNEILKIIRAPVRRTDI